MDRNGWLEFVGSAIVAAILILLVIRPSTGIGVRAAMVALTICLVAEFLYVRFLPHDPPAVMLLGTLATLAVHVGVFIWVGGLKFGLVTGTITSIAIIAGYFARSRQINLPRNIRNVTLLVQQRTKSLR